MHTEDGDDESGPASNYYGVWPTIVGLAVAGGLTWFMFRMADGFA